MKSRRKILIVVNIIISIVISSLVLMWGDELGYGEIILIGLIFIQLILIIFLGIDLIRNKND